MAEAFDPYRFLWWRFNEYIFADGFIVPCPTANLEMYDPWQAYRDSWENDPDSATPFAEKRQQGPPYLSLLALADGLKFDPDNFDLNQKTKARLLKWCSEFGLLGMLHQRVQRVTLTPRWFPKNPWGIAVEHKLKRPKDGILFPSQFIYHRDNSLLFHMEGIKVQGWHPILWQPQEQGQKGKKLGQIYDGITVEQLGVLIQNMRFNQASEFPSVKILPTLFHESFQKTWSRFFPSVPKKQVETYLYPPPLSPPFWDIYAESVSDFFMGVFALRDALTSLNGADRAPGLSLLNNLIASSSIAFVTDRDGTYHQEWRAASLLGCFAMMALQDLTQQKKVIRCEKCNRLFVTEAYQARYCSDRCRHTAQKRRYRQRLKEGQENG